jgi:P-type Ca2+ transporter type 2C
VAGPVAGESWHTLPGLDAAKALHVEQAAGLTSDEAAARRGEFGPNRLESQPVEPRRRALARQYRDPMQVVLVAAGVASLLLGDLGAGLVVLALTLANAALGLHLDGTPAAAVAALQRRLDGTARVRRDGRLAPLPADQLVPGDMVLIQAGDTVPADGRLVDSATLDVDESGLTGESLPAGKGVEAIDDPDAPLGDRTDMVYMGSRVTRGTGELVVTATGMATELGRLAIMLEAPGERQAPLTRRLARLLRRIVMVGGVAIGAAIVVEVVRGRDLEAVLALAAAFAVAAVPAALPAVVTAILARGARVLARANVIVTRPRASATLGATSAIDVGLSRTLTLGELTVVELATPGHRYAVSGRGYAAAGTIKHVAGDREEPLGPYLLPLALATDAVVRDGELSGDPTEGALVVLAEKGGLDVAATRDAYPRVADLPFDASYALTATFHRMADEAGAAVIRGFVTGAPELLLGRMAATADARERYLAEYARMAVDGLTVVATARRDFAPDTFDPAANLLQLVDVLTPLALVGIADPPRPEAEAAIATARSAGIAVRAVTGDHARAADAIARQLGIDVVARASPEHKVHIVETLQAQGHVVAVVGDGVGDTPALKAADVGIARGEACREAAAITVPDFPAIVRAVAIARGLCDALETYIRFQLGVLAGMVLTFLGAAVLNVAAGLAFLPLQTLYITFTALLFQSIGVAYGEGRMPRPAWVAVAGVVHAAVTLTVMAAVEHEHGVDTARWVGLMTFGALNVLYSLALTRSPLNRAFVIASAASVTAIVIVAERL